MSTDTAQSIIAAIQQEIDWVKTLNQVLISERGFLEKSQFEQLEKIAETKQQLSDQLENSCRNRINLLNISPDTPSSHGQSFKQFLETLPTETARQIEALNQTLAEHLHECRELNSINGQVIATNLTNKKAIFEDITSGGDQDPTQATYTAQGGVTNNSKTGRYEKA